MLYKTLQWDQRHTISFETLCYLFANAKKNPRIDTEWDNNSLISTAYRAFGNKGFNNYLQKERLVLKESR